MMLRCLAHSWNGTPPRNQNGVNLILECSDPTILKSGTVGGEKGGGGGGGREEQRALK